MNSLKLIGLALARQVRYELRHLPTTHGRASSSMHRQRILRPAGRCITAEMAVADINAGGAAILADTCARHRGRRLAISKQARSSRKIGGMRFRSSRVPYCSSIVIPASEAYAENTGCADFAVSTILDPERKLWNVRASAAARPQAGGREYIAKLPGQ